MGDTHREKENWRQIVGMILLTFLLILMVVLAAAAFYPVIRCIASVLQQIIGS